MVAKEMFEELDIYLRNENDFYILYGLHTKDMLYATDNATYEIYFNKQKKYFIIKEYDMRVLVNLKLNKAIQQQMKELGWL